MSNKKHSKKENAAYAQATEHHYYNDHNNIISQPEANVNPFNQKIEYLDLVNMEVEEPKWLWWPYIPFGKITLMQGDGGIGKTFAILSIVASLTNGDLLPEYDAPLEPCTVIYQNAEDGIADTILPRLKNFKADLERVKIINDSKKQITLSDERIEQAIKEHNAKLFVLDPIQAYIGENVDMHRANEIRPILSRIRNIAEETGCAIILVGHLNKNDNKAQLVPERNRVARRDTFACERTE